MSKYKVHLQTSPYSKIKKERVKTPKFIFRTTKMWIDKTMKTFENKNVYDLGCANGELLFYLSDLYKNFNFLGVDSNKHFVNIGKKLLKDKKNVKLKCSNILKLKEKKDLIICLGTMTIFTDPKILLKKILSLMTKKSIAIIDGVFNNYNCDLIIKYKDSSTSKNPIWCTNINIHSKKTISKILKKEKRLKFNFYDYNIDTKIKHNKKSPHVNWWTEKNRNNQNYLTNGLMIKKNTNFLILQKF